MDYRQGDVGIRQLDKTIDTSKLKKIESKKYVILAESEVTGHYHGISLLDYPNTNLYETGEPDRRVLEVLDEYCKLRHQEHDEIVLPNGLYDVYIQTEYDPEGDVKVRD